VRDENNLPYVRYHPGVKIPSYLWDRICELYENGVNVSELQQIYDVTAPSIYRILHIKYKTLEAARVARAKKMKANERKMKANERVKSTNKP